MTKKKNNGTFEFLPLQLRQDVKKWHTYNQNAYKKFYKLFKRMRDFDVTFAKKIIDLVKDCVPQELLDVFNFMEKIISVH